MILQESTVRPFVVDRLRAMRDRPCMWAATREAFVAQVVLLLELINAPEPRRLYDAFKIKGTNVAVLEEMAAEVDDNWGRTLVITAAVLMELTL